ncbi:hypothetical protein MXL46_06225 [Heyndrickxia sporothermodurans]|uniref:Uncharacterized protein n=1 Tax=Heyndrickxia sporothermodurans TaxID=46224 RepID=A0A150L9W9_9BACI|nr:hypothetical protein [Heyndrickxia sporothermodurans]KYD09143.1 hypothetical protein B4102_2670 [Heyndrickxia sporothermodurans]MBL5766688.1 hypothetical protein [Heyndrickxia sporothermodurans]MBL5770136.1 hypothetical protein [Heyndrickxia sporothermodurans]MBL5774263.1 hypothetical protein [Heyndrickxia sporothermodurans]MBL5777781.1 hypothetical protein [Heyndrickxia sporothermodurans]
MVQVVFMDNEETLQVPNYKETITDLLNTGSAAIFPNLYEYQKLTLDLTQLTVYLQKQ